MLRKGYQDWIITGCLVAWAFTVVQAEAVRFRAMWRDDPATTMVIGWDQVSGYDPVLHYDEVDFGKQATAYRMAKRPDRITTAKGMKNHFVRLTGLSPNTLYYFVVKDNEGTSRRYAFQTAPDDPSVRLSIVAGGDSRNNRDARVEANRLVSKLRPHFVIFDGDMTGGDTDQNWRDWMDDWQETVGSDGRLFPVVAARGNHERENASITELFDSPSPDVYFALTFGGGLFRLYTLNSLIAPAGRQQIWLEGDLKANPDVRWKMAQYHQPMRPHTRRKPERDDLYAAWAGLLYEHGVDLVLESDAHMVKTTYPVRPFKGLGSEEGFIRDDEKGIVFIGEGCWGAPLRDADDAKSWTRATGSFNQFKWIFVGQEKIEVRTIKTDNTQYVAEVSHNNIFEPPIGLTIWAPPTGDVLAILHPDPPADPLAGQRLAARDQEAAESAPSPAETAAPSEPKPKPPSKPADKNDWSVFPKAIADETGGVVITYEMPARGDVSLQLINREWQMVTRVALDNEPGGPAEKRLDLSGVSDGEYLLVIKRNGQLLKRIFILKGG